MANYATLSGSLVTNILVADTLEMAELATGQKCIEFDSSVFVEEGCIYDPETNTFSKPAIEILETVEE